RPRHRRGIVAPACEFSNLRQRVPPEQCRSPVNFGLGSNAYCATVRLECHRMLDVRLPGQSGLDFQRELAAANRELPIIFITGHGDIPMSVQAMKGGAIEFLTKPFRDQDLLDAIQLGPSRDRDRRENDEALAALRERFASLSPREREIMIQVARGRLSKQIAGDIGLAEATAKVDRSRAMRKMNARSLPELGRMADKLRLLPEKPQRP